MKDIFNMRKGMWEKVAKRSHKPTQIYAFGAGSDDVMLHGTVDYELKDGRKTSTSWGARAHFAQEDGEPKMDFYQVYLVSTSLVGLLAILDDVTGHSCNVESEVVEAPTKACVLSRDGQCQ